MGRLRVFVAIADHQSMTAAARTLGISRSVVSAHLKHLETDLGVRLIERTTRTMAITTVGEQVLGHARQMLASGQAALDLVDAHLGSVRGVLRVSMPVDLGVPVLAPAVEVLRARHPELRIEALVGDVPVDLVKDRVDVAIRIGVPVDSALIMRRLARTAEVFVASPELADQYGLHGDIEALEDAPRVAHVLLDDPQPTVRRPDDQTRRLVLRPAAVSVAGTDLMRRFIGSGIGFGAMPDLLVRDDIARGDLVRVVQPWFRRRVEVFALTPSRVTSPAAHAFLEVVRGVLQA